MAFKLDDSIVIHGKEIIFRDVYAKITSVSGNKESVTAVVTHYTQDCEHIIKTDILSFTPDIQDDALRWDKQAYEYAKTLDDYVGAVDC